MLIDNIEDGFEVLFEDFDFLLFFSELYLFLLLLELVKFFQLLPALDIDPLLFVLVLLGQLVHAVAVHIKVIDDLLKGLRDRVVHHFLLQFFVLCFQVLHLFNQFLYLPS